MRLLPCAFAIALFSAASVSALADDAFTLTDGTNTISFTLPSSPIPNPAINQQFFLNNAFAIDNVPGVVNGNVVNLGEVRFWGGSNGAPAGIQIDEVGPNIGELYQEGADLFTGDVHTPTFIPGTYDLTNNSALANHFTGNFDLTITATPEPSTILQVGSGLFGVAGLIRRRIVSCRRAASAL